MTIYIFGDSFSDSNYEDTIYNGKNEKTWTKLLSEFADEKIKNYSHSGSGPYDALSEFYKKFENDIFVENDKIIFFLSTQYRIPFPFLKYYTHQHDVRDHIFMKKGEESKWYREETEYLKEYSYEIFLLYNTLKDEIDRYNYKNIIFLNHISKIKNIKIITFLCFNHSGLICNYYEDEPYHNNNFVKKYKLNDLNDNNFMFYEKPLNVISLEENVSKLCIDRKHNSKPNHLSWENHQILTNIITNFLYNTNLNETFFKNIFDINEKKIYELIDKEEKIGRFFYD